MNPSQGNLLVIDDNEDNRNLLARQLERQGHTITLAENGFQAIELIQTQPFDLVLLDIMMPEMNGYEVLEYLKSYPALQHIPVIVISALDDIDSVVRCIKLVEDHMFKPINRVLLKARIDSCLEKKRLRDQEQAYLQKLQAEQKKTESLLLNILPKPIADRLKQGESTIADSFAEATVMFADIVGFTNLSTLISPTELVGLLNKIFSEFDQLAEQYGLEKIKTIGDGYMVVGGIPTPRSDHAEAIAEMALDMHTRIAQFNLENNEAFSIRIGINTGPVIAGVIGTKKFIYDLWGDTVNIASRMESHGLTGCIQVTAATYERLQNKYTFENRGLIPIKGKGNMAAYLLTGRQATGNRAQSESQLLYHSNSKEHLASS